MRLPTLLLAAAIGAGACSTPQTDEEVRAVYVDAAASAFTSGAGGPALPDATATCVGESLVEVAGTDELRAAGVQGQDLADAPDLRSLDVDLPRDAVDRLAEDLAACDLAGAIERPLLDAFAAESGAPLSEGAARCVVGAADDRAVERGFAETFVDRRTGTPGFDALLQGLADCPDATTELLLNGLLTDPASAPPSLRSCVAAAVRADPDAAPGAFADPPSAAGAALVEHVAAECLPPVDVRS